ncbi:MAG: hypothetical protein MSC52_04710 [Solobacterium sp.]|nr:hypothetical protein [Solobacterium sp.]MCI7156870.1 hypothetical protein [Solobacterium sp.]
MNKKLLCVCALSLLLTGCGNLATSNVADGETVTIDATEKVNPKDYLKDLDKKATVDYEIKDNEMVITVTKGDKTENINIPVQVNEPKVSIDRHITVDKYVGYDLEQYIHEDEGVTHTTNFDEDTGKLSVTFKKGEWTTTLEDDVTVLDSNPINNWPKTYSCCLSIESGCNYVKVLNEDGSFSEKDIVYGWNDSGTFSYDGKNGWFFDYKNSNDLYYIGDYEKFVADTGGTQDGTPSYDTCTLIK